MTEALAVAVVALAAPWLALLVHEAGHASAAFVLRGRDVRLELGLLHGRVTATFDGPGPTLAFQLAGPAASFAAAACLCVAGGLAVPLGVVSAALGLSTLCGGDGARALAAAHVRRNALARRRVGCFLPRGVASRCEAEIGKR